MNDQNAQLPPIDFSTFVFSLNSSALMDLGKIPNPSSKKTNINLMVAKQTIDILAMLEEKTSGNLSSEEANLLRNMLHDLRMMYVQESSK